MCPKESKLGYYRDNCMPMFIIPLFTLATLYNLPRYQSIDEWIKKTPLNFTQPLRKK
jgi:hypothetical protein